MGWRPGKGVGPSMTKSDKKKLKPKEPVLKDNTSHNEESIEDEEMTGEEGSNATKFYGCFVPPELRKGGKESDSEDSTDIEFDEFVLAPDDIDNPLCNPKENTFGLGYSGLDRTALSFGPVDLFGGGLKARVENRKLNIRGEVWLCLEIVLRCSY
jgi:G patch domain-containing protein 1